jgi:hypothetical protein
MNQTLNDISVDDLCIVDSNQVIITGFVTAIVKDSVYIEVESNEEYVFNIKDIISIIGHRN